MTAAAVRLASASFDAGMALPYRPPGSSQWGGGWVESARQRVSLRSRPRHRDQVPLPRPALSRSGNAMTDVCGGAAGSVGVYDSIAQADSSYTTPLDGSGRSSRRIGKRKP